MKVTIHQPDFLPWLGFMQRWRVSDLLIIYDDAQFIKGGWQNRDKIGTRDGDRWLTVPVLTKGKLGQQIRDVEINHRTDWQRQHRNTLQAYFGKTPHFKTIYPAVEGIYARNHRLLMELNMELLQWAAESLGIRTPVVFSSSYGFSTSKTERILDLLDAVGGTEYITGQGSKAYLDESLFKARNLSLVYQETSDVVRDFDPGDDLPYSVIQYLFNHGPSAARPTKAA